MSVLGPADTDSADDADGTSGATPVPSDPASSTTSASTAEQLLAASDAVLASVDGRHVNLLSLVDDHISRAVRV